MPRKSSPTRSEKSVIGKTLKVLNFNEGKSETIITAAAAHHLLLRTHPFPNGNERVARWISHAVWLDTLTQVMCGLLPGVLQGTCARTKVT